MSAWMWMPYFERQIELGKMTREEADKEIWRMIEIDNMPELIVVADENDNVICSTDFTDKSKNLEVWKAIGLQEEDFYNTEKQTFKRWNYVRRN